MSNNPQRPPSRLRVGIPLAIVLCLVGCSNSSRSSNNTSSSDMTAPTVSSTSPANGATNVAINTSINVTFSEAMKASTITAAHFTVSGATSLTVSYDAASRIATLSSASAFANNTMITATVHDTVEDLAGNALASDFIWSFTTAQTGDTTPPTVGTTIPADGASGVAINSKLVASFNEAMDPATLDPSTFTFVSGPSVTGTVTYDDPSRTASYKPDQDLLPGMTYTIQLTTGVKDLAGNPLAASHSWTFTTAATPDNTPPTVSALTPNSGATGVATNQKVNATFSETVDPATITTASFTLEGPGSTPVTGTIAYVGLTGIATFSPTNPLANNTTFTGTLTTDIKDLAGNPLGNAFSWTFTTAASSDSTPPTVISTNPADGASNVPTNSKITATFSEAMDPSTIDQSALIVVSGPMVVGSVTYADAARTATLIPNQLLMANSTYTVNVTTSAEDLAGNALAATHSWTFTTGPAPDTTPPTVSTVTPSNGATGVPINQNVNATFSEPIDANTIGTGTFNLKGPGTTLVVGTIAFVDVTGVATFSPTNPLPSNTLFTATLTTGVQDLAGNALASPFTWTFTTSLAADTTPPVVIFTVPDNDSTGVATNSKITATFSESMDPMTLSQATFTVVDGAATMGQVTYADVGKTATFTPNQLLMANTLYQANLTTGVKDLAGNPLAAPYTWSFTTALAADTTRPTVMSTSPLDNAMNVFINKNVNVTFDKPMDATTIGTGTFTLTGPAMASVMGTISYDAPSQIATFAPVSNLAPNTSYTGTITTGVEDLTGNALLSDFVWSFMTGTQEAQEPIDLQSLSTFVAVAGAGLTSDGNTTLNGDVGLSPSATFVGTPAGQPIINGTLYANDPGGVAAQAKTDLTAAYVDGAARPPGIVVNDLSGMILTPGVYTSGSTMSIAVGGVVTLDGQGDANAVWIFQVGSSLTVNNNAQVILLNGANAGNVFWAIFASSTMGTDVSFKGNVLAGASNSLGTNSTVEGRMLCRTGQITLLQNTITLP